jgi:hypothetical protein
MREMIFAMSEEEENPATTLEKIEKRICSFNTNYILGI